MKGLVGRCGVCQKEIYCNHGFLEGIVREDGTLICFDCGDQQREIRKNREIHENGER